MCESKHVHTCEQNEPFFSLSILCSRWSVLQDYSTHIAGHNVVEYTTVHGDSFDVVGQ